MKLSNKSSIFSNVKTIFFDYDGTLHDSLKIYAPAFRKAYAFLVENGHANPRDWSDKDISHWLGFTSKDMWQQFMSNLNKDIKDKASTIIGAEMKKQLAGGKATLYTGTINTLKYLKSKEYNLVFISNCGTYYKETSNSLFGLSNYFDSLVCSEEYNYIPKWKVLEKIKSKYPRDMVIVGDRLQDIEAGCKNNIFTIGCTYGYGNLSELNSADTLITSICQLKELL
ncbi:HAD family hydrolase [Proteinivorax hydrogeniformans]|uniref:HAD family hydrolase n=1 Tax=Proteinivorax hydrogeniformans TaxID=1826727 RepID=A0AAU8HV66_9FIRM